MITVWMRLVEVSSRQQSLPGRLGLSDTSSGLRRVLRGIRQFGRVPLPLHISLLPLSPPATNQAAKMYAATPEAPKSRLLRLETLASSFVPVQATSDPPWALLTR